MAADAFESAVAASGLAGAVGLICNRDDVIYSRAAGLQSRESGAAMAENSLFQIASMTKAVTSVAAVQLVERGELSLDAPIGSLLPDLAAPMVIDGFEEDGTVRLRRASKPITLRHLLTHTSGLGYDFMSMDMIRARGPGGPPAPGSLAMLKTALLFDPGERWNYGLSTDWAGLAVEAASGQSLGAYLAEHVTGPLGMAETGFHPSDAQRARGASLYARTPEGLVPMPMEIGGGPAAEFEAGGAGLWSTAPDYARFVRMVLNDGTLDGARILSPESVALLKANQVGSLAAGKMETAMPELAPPYDPFPGMDCGWTLAFLTNPQPGPNGRAAGSLSWAGIANCYYWIDPANDVAGVFMSQLLPFADDGALDAFGALERMAYSAH